jgi:hypothetical protein
MRRALFLALAGAAVLSFPASARAQEDGLASGPVSAPSDGFLGPRPLLTSLSTADQKLLASLIDKYTSANHNAVIKVHENTMMDPKLHSVHQRPYTQLFTFHHTYLEGLESYLTAQGYGRFVPLPKWIPSQPIPRIFGYHNGKKVIQNFNPNQDWTQFYHSKLGVFIEDVTSGPTDSTPDAEILANTLVVPHNNTHNIIGGIMATMSSPTAPIFWCYHAFIDDIWTDWKQVHSESPRTLTARDGESETRSLEGVVRKDADGNVFFEQAGTGDSYPVTSEPWRSILSRADGKAVWLQAKVADGTLDIESVSADSGMNTLRVHSRPSLTAPTSSLVAPMSEIRIVGAQGDFFEVNTFGKGTGWIVKSAVPFGEDPATAAAEMGVSELIPNAGRDSSDMPGMNMDSPEQ